jgi:hypothetical protein
MYSTWTPGADKVNIRVLQDMENGKRGRLGLSDGRYLWVDTTTPMGQTSWVRVERLYSAIALLLGLIIQTQNALYGNDTRGEQESAIQKFKQFCHDIIPIPMDLSVNRLACMLERICCVHEYMNGPIREKFLPILQTDGKLSNCQ